jgi:hypothetical protein
MVDGMKSILHVRPILDEMVGGSIVKQPVVVGDNRPSVMILAGTTSSKRAKHFDTQGEICTRFGSVRQDIHSKGSHRAAARGRVDKTDSQHQRSETLEAE